MGRKQPPKHVLVLSFKKDGKREQMKNHWLMMARRVVQVDIDGVSGSVAYRMFWSLWNAHVRGYITRDEMLELLKAAIS